MFGFIVMLIMTLSGHPWIIKGQLISKCLFEKIVWTKIAPKNMIDSAHKLSGQNLSNFLVVFWSKRFFQQDILKLTDL